MNVQELLDLADSVVSQARKAGADVAESVARTSASLSAKVRLGKPELVKEAGSKSLGLRVMLQQRVAVTYTSDLTAHGLRNLVEDALELARLSEPDAFAGPPDPSLLAKPDQLVDLDLHDSSVERIDAQQALSKAQQAEAAALASDARITQSEGATFGRVVAATALVTSGGFRAGYQGSYASLSVQPVADDEDGKKRRGHHWSARRHVADMESPDAVGIEAARRTVSRLGARKVETQQVPVIFEAEAAASMLGLIASCINGAAIWRKTSYLAKRLNTPIASKLVTIVDDPLVRRGPGSRPCDGEGLLSRKNQIVEQGVLKSYLLDTYGGRKLQLPSTASASRDGSAGVSASTTNFILQPGEMSREELVKSTDRALYVTDMMGFGFNAVTGDFSRGASGFWVEKGEKVFPVSEVTISLNLDALLQRIDAVANDLDLRSSIASPTFRVSEMTLAGK